VPVSIAGVVLTHLSSSPHLSSCSSVSIVVVVLASLPLLVHTLVFVSIAGLVLTLLSSSLHHPPFIFIILICQHCCCGVGIIAIVGLLFGVCQHCRSGVDIVVIISLIFIIIFILSYGLIILLTTFMEMDLCYCYKRYYKRYLICLLIITTSG